MQRNFGAFEKFLDHHLIARLAELLIDHHRVNRRLRFLQRFANQNSFAQCQPIRLHHATPIQLARECLGRRREIERARPRGGDAVPRHEILREHFGRFKLRRLRVGPPNAQIIFLK